VFRAGDQIWVLSRVSSRKNGTCFASTVKRGRITTIGLFVYLVFGTPINLAGFFVIMPAAKGQGAYFGEQALTRNQYSNSKPISD
jgi:hypothetical protein